MTIGTALFTPRSVALVGASSDPLKASSRPLRFLRASRTDRRVYAVNSRGGSIGDVTVHRSIRDLPEVPQHAFIMTPTPYVLDVVEECAALGVEVATILAGGFAEISDEGLALQQRVLKTARDGGLRLVGPNSLGIANLNDGLLLTANAAFADTDLPSGGVAVASQSGSMIGALLSRGADQGVGFSRLLSVGAEVDLSIGEMLLHTLDDDDVTGYLLFLETIRHPEMLRTFAIGAAERGKPVVAYKLGRSEAAASLAASHTGALAGEDDVAGAFLADLGIPRLRTLDGLLESLPLVARVPARASAGPRRAVGVLTTTGGGAAMVVDQLAISGVDVVAASEETLDRLRMSGAAVEPGLITDLTLAGTRQEVFEAALLTMLEAPEFDVLVVVVGSSARHSPEVAITPIVTAASRQGGHPVATFVVPHAPEAVDMLVAAGLPVFRTPEACADAVLAAVDRRVGSGRRSDIVTQPPAMALLDEVASYEALARIGLPTAWHRVLPVGEPGSRHELVGAPFPLAVKALSDQIAHKREAGGVVLGVPDVDGVNAAVQHIVDEVHARAGVVVDRVLVQAMSTGLHEVLVGYRIDPQCGPIVLVADGGSSVETAHDRSIRMAPVSADEARAMLDEVTALRGLDRAVGSSGWDSDALVDVIVRMSSLARDARIAEAEVNPLLLQPAGGGITAVDAVVYVPAEPS